MRDFADFCEMSSLLTRAADVPDYTWFWWKVRPHPRLGTVEIRALDAQTSLTDTAALGRGRGGGAGTQRTIYEIAGVDAVARQLTELTAPTPE
jgi:hypothetical protein